MNEADRHFDIFRQTQGLSEPGRLDADKLIPGGTPNPLMPGDIKKIDKLPSKGRSIMVDMMRGGMMPVSDNTHAQFTEQQLYDMIRAKREAASQQAQMLRQQESAARMGGVMDAVTRMKLLSRAIRGDRPQQYDLRSNPLIWEEEPAPQNGIIHPDIIGVRG